MTPRLPLLCLVLALAACGDDQLPDASATNIVDTVTLGAIHGAALTDPAAFSFTTGFPVRTDLTAAFDFAYDIIPGKGPVLLPLAALGLGGTGVNPGLQFRTEGFDGIKDAPTDGWRTTDTLGIQVGTVLAGRSRISCYLGVPQYGKLEVLSFDDVRKTVRLKVLSNINCGYRSLEPGIPED